VFGVQAYEDQNNSTDQREKAAMEKEEVLPFPREEEIISHERLSQDFDRPSFDITTSADHEPAPPSSNLFGRLFSSTSKRFSAGSTAPLLSPAEPSPELAAEDGSAPPLPPKDHHQHDSRTGSSGSTGGQIVYVRMSDGKLVRRLSTIASLDISDEATMSRRSRSDLSGSYQTGESGGESFATARSRHESAEQEVLLEESVRT